MRGGQRCDVQDWGALEEDLIKNRGGLPQPRSQLSQLSQQASLPDAAPTSDDDDADPEHALCSALAGRSRSRC